ncbi:hypothetical protein EAG_13173 [Camponotus floridanus]|uniref:Uncharacterized protein n=1 Tax=Camponotus floridanus TaxID=104421 RepID=E2AE29_CAMFO|nr:hypothetical protein EAG_13173 [Camponotus floridanus]
MAVGSVASSVKHQDQTSRLWLAGNGRVRIHEGRYEESREKRKCRTFARWHSIEAPRHPRIPSSSASSAILECLINCG